MFTKLRSVRHAESKREEEDHARYLSDRGREDVRKTANPAKEHLRVKVEQIAPSGKPRANRTAEVQAKRHNPPNGVVTDTSLEPSADPEAWKKRLVETTWGIVLDGHLLAGDETEEVIGPRMGAVVCLERDQQRRWTIRWMITRTQHLKTVELHGTIVAETMNLKASKRWT